MAEILLILVVTVVFGVIALRVARSVLKDAAVYREFQQTKSLALVVFLYPLGPPLLFAGPARVGWLLSVLVAIGCYLPGLFISMRNRRAFERAGWDRAVSALHSTSVASATAVGGLVYVALVAGLVLAFSSIAPDA